MLYSSLTQPQIFIVMLCIGVICGLILSMSKYFGKKLGKHNIIKQINYLIYIVASFLLFIATNLLSNYGQFRFYVFFSTIIGILIEQIFFEKIWTLLYKKCYNLRDGRKKHKKENNK